MAKDILKDRIRAKIVGPLICLLVISATILIVGVYFLEDRHFTEEINIRSNEVDKLFNGLLYKESKFMRAQLNFIEDDSALIKAWRNRNRPELYDKARPIFEEMFIGFNVTHFYFIEPDGTCFLRVHSPKKFGDRIERFTFEKAVAESDTVYGIELGPLGTFTLRVVRPWFFKGKLLGYLELGEEIEHLAPRIKQITGVNLVFTIDKSFLDREEWQAGMEGLLKPKDDWERFEKSVMVDNTFTTFPAELEEFIDRNHFNSITSTLPAGEHLLNVCTHPLRDVSGKQVGSTFVVADITEASSEFRKTISLFIVIIVSITLLFLTFYYIYSGRIEKRINEYQNHLEDLVKERTKELHIALDEVKTLSGFLPICASCKQIRDDKGYWTQIESYIREHSDAEFSHGICPDCAEKLYPGFSGTNKGEG